MSDFAEFPHINPFGARGKTPIINFEPMPVPSAGIFDSPSVNVCLNSQWASIVIGRLLVLTRPGAWLGTEDEQIAAASQMMEFLAAMDCEDCGQFITDIETASDGTLRVKRGGAWVNAAGSGSGDTTVINNQTTLIQNMYPPPPTDTGLAADVRACNIADGLSNWIYDRVNDGLNAVDATTDVIAAADAVFGIFPPVYLVSDQVDDLITEIVEATTETLRAQYTTTVREAITCVIYTYLIAVGEVNDSNVDGMIAAIIASPPTPLDQAIIAFFDMVARDAIIHRSMLYQSVGSAVNCAILCPQCTYFNSVQGWLGWSAVTVGGGQTPPSIIDGHWEGTYVDPTGVNAVNCRIEYTMTEAFDLVAFDWQGNQTRNYGGGGTPAGARIFKNGTQVAISEVSHEVGSYDGHTEYLGGVVSGDVIQIEIWFRVNEQAADDPDAKATITQVQFC